MATRKHYRQKEPTTMKLVKVTITFVTDAPEAAQRNVLREQIATDLNAIEEQVEFLTRGLPYGTKATFEVTGCDRIRKVEEARTLEAVEVLADLAARFESEVADSNDQELLDRAHAVIAKAKNPRD